MRLSAMNDDAAAYEAFQRLIVSHDITILLDGIPVDYVETADEEAGSLVRIMRDERNQIIVKDGEPVRETLTGAVRIVVTPRAGRAH